MGQAQTCPWTQAEGLKGQALAPQGFIHCSVADTLSFFDPAKEKE